METSSVRKIYVDSRRKTPSSKSTSDFEFELNRTITLPRKCVAFVTDIHLPHSWYNVDDHAQFLYVQESSHAYTVVLSEIFRDGVRKIELPAGHYTGTSLASALQQELRLSTVHAGRNTYDVHYSSTTGKIEISLTNDLALTHDVSLASSTGSIWKVFNGESYVYDEALTRTGTLTYSYTASGFAETMTVSAIDPIGKTFTAVTSAGNTYRWNDTLERLENANPSSNWNWRPQFTLQFQQLQNYFSILTDHQLAQPDISQAFAAAGIPLNPKSPASINHLLRHEGHGPVVRHDWIPTTGSLEPPDLAGSWTWTDGSNPSTYVWTVVAGNAYAYTYPIGGSVGTVTVTSFDNTVPTVTIQVDSTPPHTYVWNGAALESTTNSWTWTKTTTQTFPSGSPPGNFGSFLSGILDLTGQSPPLFLISPTMTAFGTSQGPLGEHTIMRCICPNDASYGGFGGHIVDTLQNEQDYFLCGGSTLKTLRFQLMTSTGQIINLNGANWSFSIIFQDMA